MKSLPTPERLLAGLDAIGANVSQAEAALALLALGSCGRDVQRLDAYSDLDFFLIVEEAAKARFIDDLSWLRTSCELVFAHRNTKDGWKTLDRDGIFCEFAVFHPAELGAIPYQGGRAIWARDGFDAAVLVPQYHHAPEDKDWLRREALTSLFIGLKRFLRGEWHGARQCICQDAVALACRYLKANVPHPQSDGFNPWRRLESTHAEIATMMAMLLADHDMVRIGRALLVILDDGSEDDRQLVAHINAHLDLCDARG